MAIERAGRVQVLKYSPELFVSGKVGTKGSRETDFVYFSDFLKSSTDQVFTVKGPKGSGKSWFLSEANRRSRVDYDSDQGKKPFPLLMDLNATSLKQLPKVLETLNQQITKYNGNVVLFVDGTGANTKDRFDKTEKVENELLGPQEPNQQFKVVIAQENKPPFPFSKRYLINVALVGKS